MPSCSSPVLVEASAEHVISTQGTSVILAEISQPVGAALAAAARAPGGDGGP
jgi:hypothetical protein